ncbi:hypothetical protein C8J57DRAFT_1316235 [Mycena rebaudengoi]|nr:hypothetical protein C8J57DRAFT_1316235 [Mycena rebaudengoi]
MAESNTQRKLRNKSSLARLFPGKFGPLSAVASHSPAPGDLSSPDSPGLSVPATPTTPGTKSPLSPVFVRMVRHARSFTSSRKPRRTTAAEFILPPELWAKVFTHIPLWLLPAVALTCRSFQSIAQPLLFSTISTHPAELPTLGLLGKQKLQNSKYRKRILERVDFFFSPRIRAAISECWISPPSEEEDGVHTDDLIDQIFDSLHLLPNLKVLGCRYVRLSPRRLAVLQSLQLTTICLEMCFGELADFDAAPSVPLQAVTFKYPGGSMRQDQANPSVLFLSPDHLQQLHATTTSILPTLARSPPFKKLKILDIPVECIACDQFIAALVQCPALDHLSLHIGEFVPPALFESLPEGVLPLLTSFRGPHRLAAAFLNGRQAKRVDISMPCTPSRLELSLAELERGITSLAFRLEGVELPLSLLATIHSMFPALKALAVREPALASADINAVFNKVVPHPTLNELTLHIQGRDKFNLWIPPEEAAADAVSCFKKVRAALVKACPALESVRFMYGSEGGSILWRRSALSGLFIQV